jgi:hypothetical protein
MVGIVSMMSRKLSPMAFDASSVPILRGLGPVSLMVPLLRTERGVYIGQSAYERGPSFSE